ncbi:MAG: prephenate dehydratase [Pseudomonadales bacterium]|nr:prephenate dehydratase [Pseudomonadales bacterium]
MTDLEPGGRAVAFLGPPGTFSHAAVLEVFGHDVRLLDCATIDDVFVAVSNDMARYGVVPVENSTEGAVNNTLDCLVATELKIVAEVVVPIEHHFMVRPGTDIRELQKVVSHKQSLAQCRKWLAANWPALPQEEVASNAQAAKMVSESSTLAAIAGRMAAETYGLDIVSAAIQDQKDNSTRFLVMGKHDRAATGKDKTSTLIYTENRPGALFRVLEPFEQQQVSLTRIETRPSRKEAWDYVFFIDFQGHRSDRSVSEVLARLAERTVEVKLLGSYPMAEAVPPAPAASTD